MNELNRRIRHLRKDVLKLTQDEFSSRIGLSRNFISQIESGIKFPSDRTIKDICREFNINPDWLENSMGDMFIIPEDDTAALVSELLEEPDDEFYQMVLEVIRTYKQLSPDSRTVLQEFGKQYLVNMKNRKES